MDSILKKLQDEASEKDQEEVLVAYALYVKSIGEGSEKTTNKEENASKGNPYHSKKDGKFTSAPGGAKSVVDDIVSSWGGASKEQKSKIMKDAKVVLGEMEQDQTKLEDSLGGITKSLKTNGKMGPMKKIDRIAEKAANDYNGDVRSLKDIVRASMELDDPSRIDEYVEAISKEFEIDRVKNGYQSEIAGYRDVKVNIKLPSGNVGEIILATPEMLHAKKNPTIHDLSGHKLYEEYRSISDDKRRAELNLQMIEVYAAAEAETAKRLSKK